MTWEKMLLFILIREVFQNLKLETNPPPTVYVITFNLKFVKTVQIWNVWQFCALIGVSYLYLSLVSYFVIVIVSVVLEMKR